MKKPQIKRFERYVLEEISSPLIGALVIVVLLLLLGGLQEVIAPLLSKGANPALVARLLALFVPEGLARALPIALMFATLLGLSRLSADSEIKAALAGGVAINRLMRPVMVLAVGVTILSFLIGEGLRPQANSEALKVQQEIIFDNPRVIGLGEQNEKGESLVLRDMLGRAISVGEVKQGGELRDLRIVTMQNSQPPREVITAESGRLKPGSNILELFNGQRVTYQYAKPITVLTFKTGTLPVQDVQASFDNENNGGSGQLHPIFLPLPELWERTQAYREQKIKAPIDFTALHRKFAEPLAALALAFFAVSLAVFGFRSGANVGFTWAILLAFAYYATWSVFRVMGEQGALSPVIAAYAPDLIAVVAGLTLIWQANRR